MPTILPLNQDGKPLPSAANNELVASLKTALLAALTEPILSVFSQTLELYLPFVGAPVNAEPAPADPVVIGTLAVAGRMATDGTDFWCAATTDLLGVIPDNWVKLAKFSDV